MHICNEAERLVNSSERVEGHFVPFFHNTRRKSLPGPWISPQVKYFQPVPDCCTIKACLETLRLSGQ